MPACALNHYYHAMRIAAAILIGIGIIIGMRYATLMVLTAAIPDDDTRLIHILIGAASFFVAGFAVAVVADRSKVQLAVIFGFVLTILSIISTIVNLGLQPLWFQLAFVVMPIPLTLTGGRVAANWRSHRS